MMLSEQENQHYTKETEIEPKNIMSGYLKSKDAYYIDSQARFLIAQLERRVARLEEVARLLDDRDSP